MYVHIYTCQILKVKGRKEDERWMQPSRPRWRLYRYYSANVLLNQETLQAAFSKPQQATKRRKNPRVTPSNLPERIKSR